MQKAFDAKRRECSKKQVRNHEKLNYVKGCTQDWKFNFVKNILKSLINGSTQEKKGVLQKKRETVHNEKLIHTQNHFNEQVVIELVFYDFIHMKEAGG